MSYFHLGPWAYEKHYAGIEPEGVLRVPVDVWVNDLTDGQSDE
jgi:hypothetical protein